MFICPIIAGLVALSLGFTARRQVRRSGGSGAHLATVGIILGYINLTLVVVVVVVWAVAVGRLAALTGVLGISPP